MNKGFAVIDNEIVEVEYFQFEEDIWGIIYDRIFVRPLNTEIYTKVTSDKFNLDKDSLIDSRRKSIKSTIKHYEEDIERSNQRVEELKSKL